MSGRLLIWSDHAGPYGVGRFAAMLRDGLSDRGWTVDLAAGVDLFGPSAMRAFDDHETPARVLREVAPDVVVFVGASPLSNVAALETARARSLTRLVVVQGTGQTPRLGAIDVPAATVAREMRAATAVVTPSRVLLADLRAEFGLPADAGTVIPNGVPEAFFAEPSEEERASMRGSRGIPSNAVVCLAAARMEHEKGWDLLLDAVADLPVRTRERARFLWAGDGTKLGRLAALVKLRRLTDCVQMLGLVRDMVPLVALSDVFVLPTRNDVAPFAVLEAMASGLAVVSTDVGEIRSMVGDAGIVLENPARTTREHVVSALTDALFLLIEDDAARRNFAGRARERADRDHRATLMIERYDALVRSL